MILGLVHTYIADFEGIGNQGLVMIFLLSSKASFNQDVGRLQDGCSVRITTVPSPRIGFSDLSVPPLSTLG